MPTRFPLEFFLSLCCLILLYPGQVRAFHPGSLPSDTAQKNKIQLFKSMTWGYPDRAADWEENLFKDPQLLVNLSFVHSSYDFSRYYTDEWLLQENDLKLLKAPDMNDPMRRFRQNRIAAEIQGSFLFFYLGLGMVFPQGSRSFRMGEGEEWYSSDSSSFSAEIRRGSYWKAGLNLHFRKWVLYGGLRGYDGISQSRILTRNRKNGTEKYLSGAGNSVFNNFLEVGIKFRNFTIGFEKTLNIDFTGAESTSFFIGYNLFDLRNFNEKRIPR